MENKSEFDLICNINSMLIKIKNSNIYDIQKLIFELFDKNKVYNYRRIYKLILEDILEITLRIDHINYLVQKEFVGEDNNE